MTADGRMFRADAGTGRTEQAKYGMFRECVCVCVFGCEARPDAVLGLALRRIKGLAV